MFKPRLHVVQLSWNQCYLSNLSTWWLCRVKVERSWRRICPKTRRMRVSISQFVMISGNLFLGFEHRVVQFHGFVALTNYLWHPLYLTLSAVTGVHEECHRLSFYSDLERLLLFFSFWPGVVPQQRVIIETRGLHSRCSTGGDWLMKGSAVRWCVGASWSVGQVAKGSRRWPDVCAIKSSKFSYIKSSGWFQKAQQTWTRTSNLWLLPRSFSPHSLQ